MFMIKFLSYVHIEYLNLTGFLMMPLYNQRQLCSLNIMDLTSNHIDSCIIVACLLVNFHV